MNKRSLLFALLYFSVFVAACLTVAFIYHRHHRKIVALSHKYCYVYKNINGQFLSDNVLLVPTEDLARKTIDYYKINGNATFYGDITATVSPFTKIEVLGRGTDNSIIKIRVLYDKEVHEDISSSEGFVPLMALHDTLPKIKTTVHDYFSSERELNHHRDSLDSVEMHNNTAGDLAMLHNMPVKDIKRIEIRFISFFSQDMQNLSCSDFRAGSNHTCYTITRFDSITNYLNTFKAILRVSAIGININSSPHYGGVTILFKNRKSIYYCFDKSYSQVGDSVYFLNSANLTYLKKVMQRAGNK